MTRHYGVKEQTPEGDAISRAAEEIRIVGYTIVNSGFDSAKQARIAEAFDAAMQAQFDAHGGREALAKIDEHNTIRAPMIYNPLFLELAQNPNILSLAKTIFDGDHSDGAFILNQQNGVLNPAQKGYNQGAYHRDLPYQHFTSSRPLAINALYCIDPFTLENGATLVLPATHKSEAFPSNSTVAAMAKPIPAPAGSFLVLDCMLYHSGGRNTTENDRRAVNHVYTLPLIKQQIELPAVVPNIESLPIATRRLLGCALPQGASIANFYASRVR